MIVGLMNTIEITLLSDLLRLLKIHFRMGIRDNIGHPDPVSLFTFRSIPPSTIISSFRTRMMDLNLLVDVGGG
jgi:hypothetical protein